MEAQRDSSLFSVVRAGRLACLLATFGLGVGIGWAAPIAMAADSLYWGNTGDQTIRKGPLDGSGPAEVVYGPGDGVHTPAGLSIDAAAGRIYWTDFEHGTINGAPLDGSGPVEVLYGPPEGVIRPTGLAIDPAGGRVYWANHDDQTIRVASLDGSGSAEILYDNAQGVIQPQGIAIDPAGGRIYWFNTFAEDSIRGAPLDGSGPSEILHFGPPDLVEFEDGFSAGLAVDPASGHLYWTISAENSYIVRGPITGGGGGFLYLLEESSLPVGLALDPDAGRIYWAQWGNETIKSGPLAGQGLGPTETLYDDQDAVGFPGFVAALRAPVAVQPPEISGTEQVGGQLSCGQDTWAADLLGAYLYRAPRSLAYRWLRDGSEIAGAEAATYTPNASGDYSCRVTATNEAGSTSQTSPALAVTGSDAGNPDAEDPKCKRLRGKLKRQTRNRSAAGTARKRSLIGGNLKDTQRRLRRLGC